MGSMRLDFYANGANEREMGTILPAYRFDCRREAEVAWLPFAYSLWTRSLPLARSSRTSGFAQIPFAASQAAQVPFLSPLLVIAWLSNLEKKKGEKRSDEANADSTRSGKCYISHL